MEEERTDEGFPNGEIPIRNNELENTLKEMASGERLYSIALFDILGFSNFVEKNGTEEILKLYKNLLNIVYEQQSSNEGRLVHTGCVPVPVSSDWKHNQLVAQGNGFVNVMHFSDTFLIYVNYELLAPSFWLRDSVYESHPLLVGEIGAPFCPDFYKKHKIYSSFLQTCMEFFCEATISGIPLRGCISTGFATMDKFNNIFLGKPLVEAAKGETAQNSIGIAFGKSFGVYHPVYHNYFIPYSAHIKENYANSAFLSPMMLDWARYWRKSSKFSGVKIAECISRMNKNADFSQYYDNAILFNEFSKAHENWVDELDYNGVNDIGEYYKRAAEWYNASKLR